MCKKILLIVSCIFLTSNFIKAESNICKAAKDSVSALLKRKKMAFYYQSKVNANLYNFIEITNDYYKKTPVRISPSSNDTSKISKNNILKKIYDETSDKSHPLDTSNEFKRCYNVASQGKLDSAFKCDFFRKADSIMMAYDKNGKGYSGVEFPGGAGELKKFFDKNLTLNKSINTDDSSKVIRVFYSFFVNEKGEISEISLTKSNCKECEKPILEAINKMPAFVPAKDGGVAKKVKYILPFIRLASTK